MGEKQQQQQQQQRWLRGRARNRVYCCRQAVSTRQVAGCLPRLFIQRYPCTVCCCHCFRCPCPPHCCDVPLVYAVAACRRHQFTSITDWTGGLYISPGFAGSRSGALIATAWASLVHMGEEGFMVAAGELQLVTGGLLANHWVMGA
jgi:hypothetical protein